MLIQEKAHFVMGKLSNLPKQSLRINNTNQVFFRVNTQFAIVSRICAVMM